MEDEVIPNEGTTITGETTETGETEQPSSNETDQSVSEANTVTNSNEQVDISTQITEQLQPVTIFETESGTYQVVHELTLGDLLVSTLLLALISFTVISRIVRR